MYDLLWKYYRYDISLNLNISERIVLTLKKKSNLEN